MTKVSEVYKKLFHYTTWDGLIGILDSKNMWATNYKSLNDYSEINLFRDKLVSLVLPYSNEIVKKLLKKFPKSINGINKKGGIEKVIRHEAELLVDAHYSALGDDIYILSFCGEHSSDAINENGLLSQWRGYGSGGGAAIIFDTEKLEKILDQESIRYEYSAMYIADVVYSDDEKNLMRKYQKILPSLQMLLKIFLTLIHFSIGTMLMPQKLIILLLGALVDINIMVLVKKTR